MPRVHRLSYYGFGFPAALAILWLTIFMPTARAGDMVPVAGISPDAQRWSILDGQEFSGQFGAIGKGAKGNDSWIFDNGTFLSKSCLECGFPETQYLVRFENEEVLFEAETQCPVSDATIAWQGTIKDGKIEGVYTWIKKRWYWTIEKEFWFKGTLTEVPPDRRVELN